MSSARKQHSRDDNRARRLSPRLQIPGYAATRFGVATRTYLVVSLLVVVLVGRVVPVVAYAMQLLETGTDSSGRGVVIAIVVVASACCIVGGFSAVMRAQVTLLSTSGARRLEYVLV